MTNLWHEMRGFCRDNPLLTLTTVLTAALWLTLGATGALG